jgi:hypothetical protein
MMFLIVMTGVAGYLIYRNNVVGLVLSLPDSNQDFVFTGDGGGDCPCGTVPSSLAGMAQKKAGDGPRWGQSPSVTSAGEPGTCR